MSGIDSTNQTGSAPSTEAFLNDRDPQSSNHSATPPHESMNQQPLQVSLNETSSSNLFELDSSSGVIFPVAIGLFVFILLYLLVFRKKKTGNYNTIAIIGERFAGKTQLFISLSEGMRFESVPSIRNNQTSYKCPSSAKTYQLIDFCGDNISKEEILNDSYNDVHTLIHVIDGTDHKKIGDAAMFLYRILVSRQYQKRECNYVILLNKEDERSFLSEQKIVKRLEDEIEHIKASRRNNQDEDNESEEDYLKTTKQRFNFATTGTKVVSGSAQTNALKALNKFLVNVL